MKSAFPPLSGSHTCDPTEPRATFTNTQDTSVTGGSKKASLGGVIAGAILIPAAMAANPVQSVSPSRMLSSQRKGVKTFSVQRDANQVINSLQTKPGLTSLSPEFAHAKVEQSSAAEAEPMPTNTELEIAHFGQLLAEFKRSERDFDKHLSNVRVQGQTDSWVTESATLAGAMQVGNPQGIDFVQSTCSLGVCSRRSF